MENSGNHCVGAEMLTAERPVLIDVPLIQNLHLEFTRDAEQFHLCGQCPCLPHRVSANGISFHGSYTIAAGTRFIKTITWHFI